MQLRFTAAIAVTCTACGARSGLGVSEADDVRDAANAVDAPGGPCGRPAPAGTVVWRTPLPTGVTFTGPQAADASGTTYFLGMISTPPDTHSAYIVVALDSCGRQLWQTAPVRAGFNLSITSF